jgi:tRNA nucleotidyltransferase (CCA-adding enzyme)
LIDGLLKNRKFLKKPSRRYFKNSREKTKKKLKNGSVDLFIFGGQIQAARFTGGR